MLDILATGYPSFDFILPVSHSPKVGETALMDDIPDDSTASYGGCGANVAFGLTKLGFKSGVAMILGSDYLGSLYRSYLSRHGIDGRDVITVDNAKTSRSYLFRNPDGEYQNFFFPGAADAGQAQLYLTNLRSMRYGLVTVAPYHYNQQFVEQLTKANVPIMWQLKPDISAYPVDGVKQFAQASEIILMNHIEADFVKRAMALDSLEALLSDTTKMVVVTQGSDGATLYAQEGEINVDAVVTTVEDTTGAGDGFTAGFLAGFLKDYDPKTCLQMGVTVASFVLEHVGCQTNMPDWGRMQARYEEHFGAL